MMTASRGSGWASVRGLQAGRKGGECYSRAVRLEGQGKMGECRQGKRMAFDHATMSSSVYEPAAPVSGVCLFVVHFGPGTCDRELSTAKRPQSSMAAECAPQWRLAAGGKARSKSTFMGHGKPPPTHPRAPLLQSLRKKDTTVPPGSLPSPSLPSTLLLAYSSRAPARLVAVVSSASAAMAPAPPPGG